MMRVRGVPEGSPALDATPAELLAMWRARPLDEQLQAARAAARAARHIAGHLCRPHRRLFEAFVASNPEVVVLRSENEKAPKHSIALREWAIGSAVEAPKFFDGIDTPASFLGRVAEQVLHCSAIRYLHRTTLTLEGAVPVPRPTRHPALPPARNDDDAAWARLMARSQSALLFVTA